MNDTNTQIFTENKLVLHRVKFALFLVLLVPSCVLSLLIIIFFLTHQALIHIRQNQSLLILIIVSFIQISFELPMVIHFNRLGRISPAKSAYCTWWTFLQYTLNTTGEFLMVAISVQRHIFIFQPNVLNNRLYRYFLHDLPLLLCIIYPIVFYLILVVFYPCDGTQWDFTSNVCGLKNCYLVESKVLGTFDWSFNNGSPVVIIAIANIALIYRVVKQKRRQQRNVSWRRQRRMTLQLLSISCLYFFTWFPNLFIILVQQLFIPTFLIIIHFDYVFDLTYLICLLIPWICLGLFPEFTKWIGKSIFGRIKRHNTVRPAIN